MMKVRTLVNAMAYGVDEVEWYDNNWNLLSKMCMDTLLSEYGDFKVKKFNTYTDEDGLAILELIMK